jgi:hypothetical protein
MYFCYLDMSLNEQIEHQEIDDRYDEWRGTGTSAADETGFAFDGHDVEVTETKNTCVRAECAKRNF